MLDNSREIIKIFILLHKTLDSSQEQHRDLFEQLEEIVCFVHDAKVKSINKVRCKKFHQKPQRKHKVEDLAFLLS